MIVRPLLEYFFPRGESNRRKPSWDRITTIAYLGMFLFTFGHSSARHPVYDYISVPCTETKGRDGKTYAVGPYNDGSPRLCPVETNRIIFPMTVIKGIATGVAWPLYWAWHLQEVKPHD